MHALHACATTSEFSQEKPQDTLTSNKVPRSISPTNYDQIINPNFVMLPIQPAFAEPMTTAYGCPETMKYYGKGHTQEVEEVRRRFEKQAQERNAKQTPTSKSWGVITAEGLSGVVFTYPSKANKKDKKVLEVSRILVPAAQGHGLGGAVLNSVFKAIPDASWRAKSGPENFASWKSRENVGFTHLETKFDKQDDAIRRFDQRPSNNEIEGRTQIRFSYSGNTVSLAILELEYTQRCRQEAQSASVKSRTHFLPIVVTPPRKEERKSISPVGVDGLIHEEVRQSNAQKKSKSRKIVSKLS